MNKMVLNVILASVLAITAAGCATGEFKAGREQGVESGYFVDHEEAVRRGGAGNYASREYYDSYAFNEGDDSIRTSRAAPASPSTAPNGDSRARLAALLKDLDGAITFDLGSARLPRETERRLAEVGKALAQAPEARIRVEGYADALGSSASNRELSRRRAESVRAALIRGGAKPAQLSTESHGEERPVASNDTDEGRMKNRRVELEDSSS